MLNESERQDIQKRVDDHSKLRDRIGSDYLPAITNALGQQRNIELHFALVSGTIAAFIIAGLATDVMHLKGFAYLSLVMLLFIVGYSLLHIGGVITQEINSLYSSLKTYMAVLDELLTSEREALRTENFDPIKNYDSEGANKLIDSIDRPESGDNSLSILSVTLVIALVSLVLSIVPPLEVVIKEFQSLF